MFEIKYLTGAFIISCCVMANAREVSFLCHDNSSRDCLGRTVTDRPPYLVPHTLRDFRLQATEDSIVLLIMLFMVHKVNFWQNSKMEKLHQILLMN